MITSDTEKAFCRILFDLLEKWGVKDVVCSPGSRNAPLLIAAAARQEMKKHFVADERSAAFVGLGLALLSKTPVALICTSGTALLNYSPAVAEAYYQGVPLIIISADRPIQWIDQDDSQTLRQDEALANYVKKSYSLPAFGDNDMELQWYTARTVNDALSVAIDAKPGPVHINIHLGEPLHLKIERTQSESVKRFGITLRADAIGNKEIIRELAGKFVSSKVFIVAGFMRPDEHLQKELAKVSRFPNVVIMAETLSNLHLNEEYSSIDSTLTAYDQEIVDTNSPSLVISIGGSLVSRKLKEYLRRNSEKFTHWSLGFSHTTADCFMAGVERIETEPSRFLKNLISFANNFPLCNETKEFKKTWSHLRTTALELKNNFIRNSGWSELKAFNLILGNIPLNYNLFMSNGTPVRYAQIITHKLPHGEYCNRGVSGIDGSVSSAIGGAIGYKRETILITGDLSFSYDIGALSIREIPDSFKIIVIDNQGGGIFRFIPSTSSLEEREEYFCQPPVLPLRELAEGYKWKYFEATDEVSLQENFNKLLLSTKKSILRVIFEGMSSAEILRNYMNAKVSSIASK